MIYTIGYQKQTMGEVKAIMQAKDIDLLVDVRTWPYSRNPVKQEFNKNRLQEILKGSYFWTGEVCGGKSGNPVSVGCINKIANLSSEQSLLLMCMENHPFDCHRFYDIGRRLGDKGIEVIHLFDGQEQPTGELQLQYDERRHK